MNLAAVSPLMPGLGEMTIMGLVLGLLVFQLVVFVVVLRDRLPLSTTALWALVVLFVPVAGPLGYLYARRTTAGAVGGMRT